MEFKKEDNPTLLSAFAPFIKEAIKLSAGTSQIVTEENVFQPGNKKCLAFVDQAVSYLAVKGSGVSGMQNLVNLFEKAKEGKSCLLLLEHFSNLDLPAFSYLLRNGDNDIAAECANEIDDNIIAIAGIKLSESNPAVAAFTNAFTRIVISPSRSKGSDPSEKESAEYQRIQAINLAAMRTLTEKKTQGKIVLVFPSGTRYRPWDPSTRKGVREIDSYIKTFDYMSFVAVNGNSLLVREGDMIEDYVVPDLLRFTVSQPELCKVFRTEARGQAMDTGAEDFKQVTVDKIMARLFDMHEKAEAIRQKQLETIVIPPLYVPDSL
jgi:glycerol-3-phosphate O-acyltransferase